MYTQETCAHIYFKCNLTWFLFQKLKLDVGDDGADAAMENISSPSSAAELSADEETTAAELSEATMETAEEDSKDNEEGEVSKDEEGEVSDEEGEIPSKDEKGGEKPTKGDEDDLDDEGEEGEILSDSDEDEQAASTAEATNETTTASSKLSEGSDNKKGSSHDRGSRDGRRSLSPRDRYQDRRRYRHSGHSQSPSSSSRSTTSSNHLARKGVKRPASSDRRSGMDIRNRKEGSPFTKKKPKMKAPPPSNSPFWGERKHLLPTPSISPRTGYNLDSDYPQLPRRLVKEYFLDPPIRFVRDSHNFPSDYNKYANSQSFANKQTERDNDVSSQSPVSVISNEDDVEDMAAQECEGAVPSLPSMQDLVKNQLYKDSSSEMDALPPPLIENKSMDTAESLADVFSEDFPLLDGETPDQEEATSLKKLVAGGSGAIDITIAAGEQKVVPLIYFSHS